MEIGTVIGGILIVAVLIIFVAKWGVAITSFFNKKDEE